MFQRPFFEYIHKALKPGGVLCTQAESLWLHMPCIKEVTGLCKDIFAGGKVSYAYTTIPTYPSGQIGLMICTKAAGPPLYNLNDPAKQSRPPPTGKVAELGPLKYYDASVHSAAFVLPKFAKEELAANLSK